MNIEIMTAGFNQPELLHTMLESARKTTSHELRFRVFLHSLHEGVVRVCEEQAKRSDVIYHPYGTNRGLARSWNDGFLDGYAGGADVVMAVNDDIQFSLGDIDKIAEAAVAHRECFVIFCEEARGLHPVHWSCFVLNPIALERVGCFDENFFPATHEDEDYTLRARGLPATTARGTMVHHVGAASRNSLEIKAAQDEAERQNRAYFVRKWRVVWGGSEGDWFKTPFNDPQFDFRIDSAVRHAPYPGYNRPEVQ